MPFLKPSLKVAKLRMASNAVVTVVAAREPENEKSFTLQTDISKVLYIRYCKELQNEYDMISTSSGT